MMKVVRSLVVLAVVLPTLAYARLTPRAQNNSARPSGFTAEFLANLDDTEAKLMELAESTPAEKYSWRPGTGVRSIGEVYMHIAGANYFLATFLGVDAPKRSADIEKTVTKKADVIAELRRSFDHIRQAALHTNDLDKSVKMFGKTTTHRGVLLTVITHLHEHLGQSIAYARMTGLVPPWSR
jgi:uncharacterized damage-inducible protein DinB